MKDFYYIVIFSLSVDQAVELAARNPSCDPKLMRSKKVMHITYMDESPSGGTPEEVAKMRGNMKKKNLKFQFSCIQYLSFFKSDHQPFFVYPP